MKPLKLLPLLFVFITSSLTAQEIINGNFEIWSSATSPDGWSTYDDILPGIAPSGLVEIDTADSRQYNASVKISSMYVPALNDTVSGFISYGANMFDGFRPEYYGTPYHGRPDSIHFSYKYSSVNNDYGWAQIQLRGNNYAMMSKIVNLYNTNGLWVDTTIDFSGYYQNSDTPDTLRIEFYSGANYNHTVSGSVLHVDGVRLGNETCDKAQLTGEYRLDINHNQQFETNELPVKNQICNIGETASALSNANGYYSAFTDSGVQILKPVITDIWTGCTVIPDSIIIHANQVCQVYDGNNFLVIPYTGFCTGDMTLVNVASPPRPGFINDILIKLSSIYTQSPLQGILTHTYGPYQDYVTASPLPTNVDTVNRIITWNLSNINTAVNWQATVKYHTDIAAPLNGTVNYTATLSGTGCARLDSLNNNTELRIFGAYDPNDKVVSPAGVGISGQIPSNTALLTYTIRFQNTGTYYAQDVKIVDTLSNLLNINTLKIKAASHNYAVQINGREITFKFMNILLPDSHTNEPGSHGYIQYTLQPTAAFTQGSSIENTANIYFDFNTAIRTNTAISTANNFLSIENISNKQSIDIFPNPATDRLNINVSTAVEYLKIYNANGKLVLEMKQPGNRGIDISQLSTGTYIAEVTLGKGTVHTQKFIKM